MSVTKSRDAKPRKNGTNGEGLKGGVGGSNLQIPLDEAAAKLAASKKPPELRLPPKSRLDMSALELLEMQEQEAGEKDSEIAAFVGDWMEKESLPFIEKIRGKVEKLGKKVLQLVAGKNEEGENITLADQLNEYERLNAEYLSGAFPIGDTENGEPFLLPAMKTRRVAHMAVLKHRLSTEMDRDSFIKVINSFVEEGYFIGHQEGAISVWKKRFFLSDDEKFGNLGEEQERLLADIVGHHVTRINTAYKDVVRDRAEELKKESSLDLQQLLKGEAGKCFVHVPAETRGGFKSSEVNLLLEGDGEGKVFILDAVGPDTVSALDIKNSKIHLNLQHMGIPRPPRVETMMDKWGFSQENAERYQHFWGYADRARKEQEAEDRRKAEKELVAIAREEEKTLWEKATEEAPQLKEEYAGGANISIDRVLLEMEPMEGIFYGEFEGEWKNRLGNVPKGLLFAQFEQVVRNGKTMMKVRKAPSWLLDRFFKDQNMEFSCYGESFQGLEQPMQGLMKALHTQARHQAEIA